MAHVSPINAPERALSRRRLVAGAAIALALLASGCAEMRAPPPPAEATGRLSVLIGENVDRNLGPATVSLDGREMGSLDPGCGVIIASTPGRRELAVDWAERSIAQTVTIPAEGVAAFEVQGDLSLKAIEPIVPTGPSCSG